MKPSGIWPLLLGTGAMLGLGSPLAKAAAPHGVGTLAFALWPTLAAGLLLGLLGLVRRGRPVDPLRLLRFGVVAGSFGHAVPMAALYGLSSHAGAGFASLSLALPPVFTLAITLLLGLERPAWRRVVAVALGLAGALLMLGARGGSFEATPGTLALALLIPASIGAANVYRSRRMPPGAGGEWMASSTLLVSCALLGATGAVVGGLAVPFSGSALGWLGLQAVALVVGYLFYFALQRRAEPVTFSFIGYVMMAVGVGIGTLAFDERLPWTVWPALVLVLVALRLLRSPRPDQHPAPAAPAVRHGNAA